jgi:putative ABC transport system permease protein
VIWFIGCFSDTIAGDMPSTPRLPLRCARGAGLVLVGLVMGGGGSGAQGQTAFAVEPLPTVLVSRQLLAARRLAVGDVITLSGEPSGAHPRRFRIVGMYEPVPDPIRIASDRLEVRLHLPDLLDLTAGDDPLGVDSVSAINLTLARPDEASAYARELSTRVPTIAARPSRSSDEEGNPFVVLGRFHLAIALLTVSTSAVFLLALTVLMADERRVAVGILRLIGFRRRRVLLQVLVEGAFIAVAGAAFGVGLAAAAEGAFNRYFQWRYDTALVFVRISPAIVWQCLAMALPLGIAASVGASWALVKSETLALIRR